jgi:hypothetical protein
MNLVVETIVAAIPSTLFTMKALFLLFVQGSRTMHTSTMFSEPVAYV